METYDLIAVGSGSAMTVVQAFLSLNPRGRVAVVDQEPPGGICLRKGCIPTKLLVYPAELLRLVQGAPALGIDVQVRGVDFPRIMARMRAAVARDVASLREGFRRARQVDFVQETARFTGPRQLQAGHRRLQAPKILLCLGSRPAVPGLPGLEGVPYLTSDTVLALETLPRRLVIVGGGYIAAEYGHFFAAMGSEVVILGRNPQFLPAEEPEVAALARRELGRHMEIRTGWEALAVDRGPEGIRVAGRATPGGRPATVTGDALLLAAGRAPNTDLIDPGRSGIATDERGWIRVDERLETTCPGVYALGDALGRHMFKHAANYEARVVFANVVQGRRETVRYPAVPHAVFIHPEIAAVGLTERQAAARYGEEGILIGFQRFRDTARGEAMGGVEGFVKIVAAREDERLLGAHVVGPQASLLIQELVTVMHSREPTAGAVADSMHIHPALSEVVEWACGRLMPPAEYRRELAEADLAAGG